MMISLGWSLAILITCLPITWQFLPQHTRRKKFVIDLIFTASSFSFTLIAGLLLFIFYHKIVKTVREKIESFPESQHRSKSPGVKVCILSTIVFFICWIPYTITEILIQSNVRIPDEIIDTSYFILLLGPCVDPLLYAYYREDFRNHLLQCFVRMWISVMNHIRRNDSIKHPGKQQTIKGKHKEMVLISKSGNR